MGKTVFVLLHAQPAAPVGRHDTKVRVTAGESKDSALARLAAASCGKQDTCHMLAAKQDIQQNGENHYATFHRRVFYRRPDGHWAAVTTKSWDMTMEETMASLANAEP